MEKLWDKLLDHVEQELGVLKKAPVLLLLIALGAIYLAYSALDGLYSERLENERDLKGNYLEQRDDARAQLAEIEDQILAAERQQSADAIEPTAIVIPRPLQYPSGTPLIKPGEQLRINVGAHNRGPAVARDVQWTASIRRTTLIDGQSWDEVLDAGFAEIEGILANRPKNDLVPNDGNFGTLAMTFTEEQIADLKEQKSRFFVISIIRWQDSAGAHETEKCVYLAEHTVDVGTPVWRNCNSHNYSARPIE